MLGETGTGKELFAKMVHNLSKRKDENFVTINCGALPSTLIESELFGYEKGAFTGADKSKIGLVEAADKGTLFLDEIGDAPLELQVKLLRLIQEKEFIKIGAIKPLKVDIRIISATNKDLIKLMKENKFREDLFYRISSYTFNLPPLRERKEDILVLSNYFIEKFTNKHFPDSTQQEITHSTKEKLLSYYYPGNTRELENIIERAVIEAEGKTILPENIKITITKEEPKTILNLQNLFLKFNYNYKNIINETEKQLIQNVLLNVEGSKLKALKKLDISRSALDRKIKTLNINYEKLNKSTTHITTTQQTILNLITENDWINYNYYYKKINKSSRQFFSKNIKQLLKNQLIERKGKGKSVYYVLKSNLH